MTQQGRSQRRGPKGYTRSDDRIKEDVCEQLMQSAHIDASEITIEVRSGNVTLEGTVPERRMKHAIEDLVDSVAGVNEVENRIRVNQPGMPQGGFERSASQSEARGSSGSSGGEGSSGTSGSSSFGSKAGSSDGTSSTSSGSNTASRGPGNPQSLAGESTSSSSTAKPAK